MPSMPKTIGIAGGTGLLAGGGGYLYGGAEGLEQGRREGYRQGYEKGLADAKRQQIMATPNVRAAPPAQPAAQPSAQPSAPTESSADTSSKSSGEKNAFLKGAAGLADGPKDLSDDTTTKQDMVAVSAASQNKANRQVNKGIGGLSGAGIGAGLGFTSRHVPNRYRLPATLAGGALGALGGSAVADRVSPKAVSAEEVSVSQDGTDFEAGMGRTTNGVRRTRDFTVQDEGEKTRIESSQPGFGPILVSDKEASTESQLGLSKEARGSLADMFSDAARSIDLSPPQVRMRNADVEPIEGVGFGRTAPMKSDSGMSATPAGGADEAASSGGEGQQLEDLVDESSVSGSSGTSSSGTSGSSGGSEAAEEGAEAAEEGGAEAAEEGAGMAERLKNLGMAGGGLGIGAGAYELSSNKQAQNEPINSAEGTSSSTQTTGKNMNSFLKSAGITEGNAFVKAAEGEQQAQRAIARQVARNRRGQRRGDAIGTGAAIGSLTGAAGGALAGSNIGSGRAAPLGVLVGGALGGVGGGYIGSRVAPESVKPSEVDVRRQGEGLYQAVYPEGNRRDIQITRSPMGGYLAQEARERPGMRQRVPEEPPNRAPRTPEPGGRPLQYTDSGSPIGRAKAMDEDRPSNRKQKETKQASIRSFRWIEKAAEPPQKALAQHAGQGPTTKRKHPAGAKSEKARQMLKKILMMKMLRAKQQRKQQEMQRGQGAEMTSSGGSGNAAESSSNQSSSTESGSSESGSEENSSEESGEGAAEKEAAKTCPHCGGEITDEGKCPKCGKEVSPEKEANLPDSYLLTDMAKAAAAEGAFKVAENEEAMRRMATMELQEHKQDLRKKYDIEGNVEEAAQNNEEVRQDPLYQKGVKARQKELEQYGGPAEDVDIDKMGSDCGCGEKTAGGSKTADDDPCWDGYEQIGMKTKNGKKVPNCVPKDDSKESAKTADESGDSDPCWDGYKQVGMKTKDGNKVPNCVPKDDSEKNSSTYGTFARAFAPTGSPVYLPPETETSEKIARAYDQGKISEDEAIYLGALKKAMDKKADTFSKTAKPGKVYGTGMIDKAKRFLGDESNRRLLAQGLLGAGLAAGPVASGVSKAIDPIRERIRYNRMMELPGREPKLIEDHQHSDEEERKRYGIEKDTPKEEANERARRQAFSILHEHAPQLTKTPVVARRMIAENLNSGQPQLLLDEAVRKGRQELERQEKKQRVSGNRSRSMMDAAKAVQP